MQESSLQNKSVWIDKKEEQLIEKDIENLANRINLLQKEEKKTVKKIAETQKRTKDILTMKKGVHVGNQKKQGQSKNNDEFLELMKKKSYELRKQQEEEKKAIKSTLLQLKKEETEDVKKQSRMNKEKI